MPGEEGEPVQDTPDLVPARMLNEFNYGRSRRSTPRTESKSVSWE